MIFCRRARAKLDSEINKLRLTKSRRLEIEQAQRTAFENSGLMFDSAISETTSLFRTLQIQRFDDSMHYEIFVAIGQIHEVRSILEIGTS